MSFLWEKSGTWRWAVTKGKQSKGFFLAFTSICLVSSWALGVAVMQTTNLSQTQLDEELRKRNGADPMMMGRISTLVLHFDDMIYMMGAMNKERLGQYLTKRL
ncbi:hypothetical protein M758_UG161600 [Ceratodon purpureus]|nr:hypothetical protein M758_UG161600 [Ceratodon purpureus]